MGKNLSTPDLSVWFRTGVYKGMNQTKPVISGVNEIQREVKMNERLEKYEEKMLKTLDNLEEEYQGIRAGRANPHILDRITCIGLFILIPSFIGAGPVFIVKFLLSFIQLFFEA